MSLEKVSLSGISLLLTACATVPAQSGAGAMDPVGVYTFASQGTNPLLGKATVTRDSSGRFAGSVSTPAVAADMPITAVATTARSVRITARGAQGDAVLSIEFNGSNFTGGFIYGGTRGFLSGTCTCSAPGSVSFPPMGEPGIVYTGTYVITSANLEIKIFEDHGHLSAQATGQRSFPLSYAGNHHFDSPTRVGIALEFAVENGRGTGLTLLQHGKRYQATRVE